MSAILAGFQIFPSFQLLISRLMVWEKYFPSELFRNFYIASMTLFIWNACFLSRFSRNLFVSFLSLFRTQAAALRNFSSARNPKFSLSVARFFPSFFLQLSTNFVHIKRAMHVVNNQFFAKIVPRQQRTKTSNTRLLLLLRPSLKSKNSSIEWNWIWFVFIGN